MLPYQITRYCPNVKYPQNAVNAKHSFPRSWKCFSVMRSYRSRYLRHAIVRRVKLASAATHPPMNTHQPYIVLWKWRSSDIDRSHESTIHPNANENASATAM